jgi:hypothetical protein
VVGQRDFARPHRLAPADQTGVADGVVRAAERAVLEEPAIGREKTGDAVNLGHHQRLFEVERRQERGEAPSQHRLAPARRADQEQIVSTRGGDLEAPYCPRTSARSNPATAMPAKGVGHASSSAGPPARCC